jgi:NAD(P)-dependent dehydrogenase (short-subunit alcohol dehydrogenase family)
MKIDLDGKCVVITGAAGAIGGALSCAFASSNAKVAVCDVNDRLGNMLVDEIRDKGGTAGFYHFDVTNNESIEKSVKEIEKDLGFIEVLINNAGVNVEPEDRRPVHTFIDGIYEWIMDIDLHGIYRCSKTIIPSMIKAGKGSIINISSIAGLVPLRNQNAFIAAKTAVINLSKSMALEYAEMNIRVNVIAPGSIMFEKTRNLIYNDPKKAEAMLSHIPLKRPGDPEDINNIALFLAGDESNYITGSTICVDGGWTCGFSKEF